MVSQKISKYMNFMFLIGTTISSFLDFFFLNKMPNPTFSKNPKISKKNYGSIKFRY